nr:Uncharacterised protein [Klebsiella pneumoniae]
MDLTETRDYGSLVAAGLGQSGVDLGRRCLFARWNRPGSRC